MTMRTNAIRFFPQVRLVERHAANVACIMGVREFGSDAPNANAYAGMQRRAFGIP